MFIYKITNVINDKIYIGQTRTNLKQRWIQHISSAKSETGFKCPIHKAIRDLGIENFSIEEIDTAKSRAELSQKEKYYVKYFNSFIPNGYNSPLGLTEAPIGSRKGRNAKTYKFISPSGIVYEITNLKKFCEENSLDQCHMYNVANGKRSGHKGWRFIGQKHIVYTLYNDTLGIAEEVLNFYGAKTSFCKKYNIDDLSGVCMVCHGKIKKYKGWTLKKINTIYNV